MKAILLCVLFACAVSAPASAFSTTRKNNLYIVRGERNGAQPSDEIDIEDSSGADRYPAPQKLCIFLHPDQIPSNLTVGVYDSTANACAPVGIFAISAREEFAHICAANPSVCAFELAAASANCKVWWREVNQDVIPPIPELVIPLGATPEGEKLALCRDFQGHLGALYLEGDMYGRCVYEGDDGAPFSLDGGRFHVLQGVQRQEGDSCVESEPMARVLQQKVLAIIDAHVTAEDAHDIEGITGKPFEDLKQTLANAGSCFLQQVMSSARFVPSDANVLGLPPPVPLGREDVSQPHPRPRVRRPCRLPSVAQRWRNCQGF